MREILEPLAAVPGVRTAVLVTSDGVPIAVHGRTVAQREGEKRDWIDSSDDLNALAGLATSWLAEVARAVAPLSWGPPRAMSLRAARGTLSLMQAPNALLLVLLERGADPEQLRLPMEAAVARMQRVLRGAGRPAASVVDEVPGALPARNPSPEVGAVASKPIGVPGVTGER